MLDALIELARALAERQPDPEAAEALVASRWRGPVPVTVAVDAGLVRHYDLLARLADGTLSVSFAPRGELPWPLRGAQPWRDQHVVSVNGRVLDVSDLMGLLDFVWDDRGLLQRVVDACLIREAADTHGLESPAADLQRAMDDFRAARDLHDRGSTEAFAAAAGFDQAGLEAMVEQPLLAKLVAAKLCGDLEASFAAHRDDFDRACALRIRGSAEALAALPAGTPLAVAAAAATRGLAADVVCLYRFETPAALQAALFDHAPAWITLADERYHPLSHEAATFDAATRRKASQRLLEAWLADRRRTADIRWYWGRVDDERPPR